MAVATQTSRETKSETVAHTIPLTLETSKQKNETVQWVINEQQQTREWTAAHIVTYPSHEWGTQMGLYSQFKDTEFKDSCDQFAASLLGALNKTATMFDSWESNGQNGSRPTFGDANYCTVPKEYLEIEPNDTGFGVKMRFEPYKDGVWWHINDSEYSREYLERVVDDDDPASFGASEVFLEDDGSLRIHLVVQWPVDVYKIGDVDRTLGVDLNVDPLTVAAVRDADGEIEHVDFESGAEFKHHRERLKVRREEAQRRRRDQRVLWQEYTEHIANVASRRVVDVAAEHAPIVINLEDLTNYRESASGAIHDWPYALIQEKIAYKATEAGIPVRMVDPRYTSVTCRKCGVTNKQSRSDRDFECVNCGYEVHADANAAMNIAARGVNH